MATSKENQISTIELIEQGRAGPVDEILHTQSTELHRGLKARQVAMIALGGAIGTGLIIGTGNALTKGGPGSILIAYSFVGFIVWLVMTALGEMAVWLPISEGFAGYATRFCDPALGFALGWTYWIKYIIIIPNQLTAAALVIQYWDPNKNVNPAVFITIFLFAIVFINYFGIKYFGEFEFWLSAIKVLTLCGLIILSVVLALGGNPQKDATGFRYWKDPGPFSPWNKVQTGTAKFVAFWSVLGYAVFAYLGTELIGVTVGEAQNPRKTIPRAIKLTFYRILFFYCLLVLLLGMITRYDFREHSEWRKRPNQPKVSKREDVKNDASGSPFVAAIYHANIKVLPDFLNVCILLFVFSASNSDLYIASRTLYGLALQGKAPRILAKTNSRGVPTYSLLLSSLFSCLAYVNATEDTKKVFDAFITVVSSFGLLAWISILVSHICFVRARKAQAIPEELLVYKAPLGIWGSFFALFFCCLIALTKSFPDFIVKDKDTLIKTFVKVIEGYISIPIYLIMLFGYKWVARTKTVNPLEADLMTGKEEIDSMERKFLLARESEVVTPQGKFYKKYISWLF